MKFFAAFILFISFSAFSQTETGIFTEVDSLYREDQFYFAVTYNRLHKTPADFTQNGLSTGFYAGFLRDMPVNKKRTKAIAIGIGISYNKYHQDLLVTTNSGDSEYEILRDVNYSRNKLEQVFAEIPLELRWRNSTPESTKFWRIYAGFKLRVLVFDKSKFVGDNSIKIFNNPDLNRLQYGPMLSAGYNTWNFHVYYGLNSLFKSGTVDGQKLEMTTLNLGLMFYIL